MNFSHEAMGVQVVVVAEADPASLPLEDREDLHMKPDPDAMADGHANGLEIKASPLITVHFTGPGCSVTGHHNCLHCCTYVLGFAFHGLALHPCAQVDCCRPACKTGRL